MQLEETMERVEETESPFPRNVKQMGSLDKEKTIYMEDYVYTFLGQLSRSSTGEHLAVLVGEVKSDPEGRETVLISGAIEGRETAMDADGTVFTEESWSYIHRQMALYFQGLSIVGWAHIQPDFGVYLMGKDEAFHKECFSEQGHVLFLMDPVEKTDSFYVYDQSGRNLRPARGYFLYYEKNEPMQNYMVEHSTLKPKQQPQQEEEPVGGREAIARFFGFGGKRKTQQEVIDRIDAAGRIRRLLLRKEEAQTAAQHRYMALSAVCGSLCVACFLMAVHLVQNNGRIRTLEGEVLTMQANYDQMNAQLEEAARAVFASAQVTLDEAKAEETAEATTENTLQEEATAEEPTTEGTVPQEKAATIYQVQAGDTLGSISMAHYGTVDQVETIRQANGLSDENWILEGDRLLLP